MGWGRGEGAVDGVCEDVAGEGVVADDVGGGGDGVVDWDVFGGELEDYFYFTFTFYFHFLLLVFSALIQLPFLMTSPGSTSIPTEQPDADVSETPCSENGRSPAGIRVLAREDD